MPGLLELPTELQIFILAIVIRADDSTILSSTPTPARSVLRTSAGALANKELWAVYEKALNENATVHHSFEVAVDARGMITLPSPLSVRLPQPRDQNTCKSRLSWTNAPISLLKRPHISITIHEPLPCSATRLTASRAFYMGNIGQFLLQCTAATHLELSITYTTPSWNSRLSTTLKPHFDHEAARDFGINNITAVLEALPSLIKYEFNVVHLPMQGSATSFGGFLEPIRPLSCIAMRRLDDEWTATRLVVPGMVGEDQQLLSMLEKADKDEGLEPDQTEDQDAE